MEIKVFVSNLAKYNDGELNGQWTTLPVDDVNKDILDKLDRGGDSKQGYHDEWFISDYEAPFKIGEYDNLYALNELAEALEDYDSIEDVYNDLLTIVKQPVARTYTTLMMNSSTRCLLVSKKQRGPCSLAIFTIGLILTSLLTVAVIVKA